jgi:hypothetical protein
LFIATLEKHPRFSLHCYTNPYRRQLQKDAVPAGKIQEKIDQSSQMARKNVLTMTPQLKKLIAEWEALFPIEERDLSEPRQGGGEEGKAG